MQFQVPPSVCSYCNDVTVEAAVEALLTKPGKVPPDLEWEELHRYYDGWVAAHRVMIDYAKVLAQLWAEVWKDVIPQSCTPVSVDDQITVDSHADPHPATCWDNEWFLRSHKFGAQTLYTGVSLEKGMLSVGAGLFGKNGRSSAKGSIEGFEFDSHSELYWSVRSTKVGTDGVIDLEPLLGDRAAALGALLTPETS